MGGGDLFFAAASPAHASSCARSVGDGRFRSVAEIAFHFGEAIHQCSPRTNIMRSI